MPKIPAALAVCFACVLASAPCRGFELDTIHAGVRASFSNEDVLGKVQTENFHEYDLWATVRLPWQHYGESGWGVGTRLLGSAGLLKGAGQGALALSIVPVLALGSEDRRFALDFGIGLALLSRSQFGTQEFGGLLQGALTLGVTMPLYRRLGVGYRFMHYSDAGIYGHDTIGADLHTVEFSYRF
jgi:hypothetical protein